MVFILSYERLHAVRVCRERCAEEGYYGEAFHSCVERCVEEILRGGASDNA